MRYMRMPVSGLATVTIPQLNGGVNVYDVPNRVGDNQLTECNNLWWHGGALRTRPGLLVGQRFPAFAYTHRQIVDERTALLYRFVQEGESARFYAAQLTAQGGGFAKLGAQGYGYAFETASDKNACTALGIRGRKNDDTRWYYLLSNGAVIKENPDDSAMEGAGWVATDPYIPTVLINGVGEDCEAEAEPTTYEDYNMLTRAFQCHYTTDGVSSTWKLPMGNLATDLPGVDRENENGGMVAKIEVDVFGENGLRTIQTMLVIDENGHIVQRYIDENGEEQTGRPPLTEEEAGLPENWSSISLEVDINPRKGVLTTTMYGAQGATNANPISGGLPYVTSNNLRVTVWRSREYEKDRLTICKMTRGEWFGGDASGIAGGTRYFVCGNPDEPDLLCWSGIEHPLYFPEHNRVRVGDDHQAITAMGKQGSLLVLYKEQQEMYALQYSAGTADDYAFAESGGVAVTSYMAKFLLTPINASVGCDCPDTVRLVNNRLVWANSDGSVYMLTATNPYSERNVRMISRNVRRLLADCGAATLQDAQAGEYEGYYLLLAGNRVFLMNTQTSAFSNFNYYDDENAAAKAIPWFVWTLPEHLTYTGMLSAGNALRMMVTTAEEGALAMLTSEADSDDGAPIPCRMTTKLWDFGMPDRKKSVEHLYMGLGCADPYRLQVTYVTEQGRMNDPHRMENSLIAHEGYLLRRHLTPNVRMVQAFGLCLDSPVGLELDEIQMKIRQQGVVR